LNKILGSGTNIVPPNFDVLKFLVAKQVNIMARVDVQFDLDINGILILTAATEVGNSNTGSIRIDNISGRLFQYFYF
jgi:molecular chaperone DnaK (HSP70)